MPAGQSPPWPAQRRQKRQRCQRRRCQRPLGSAIALRELAGLPELQQPVQAGMGGVGMAQVQQGVLALPTGAAAAGPRRPAGCAGQRMRLMPAALARAPSKGSVLMTSSTLAGAFRMAAGTPEPDAVHRCLAGGGPRLVERMGRQGNLHLAEQDAPAPVQGSSGQSSNRSPPVPARAAAGRAGRNRPWRQSDAGTSDAGAAH